MTDAMGPKSGRTELMAWRDWLVASVWPAWLEYGVDWENQAFLEYLNPSNWQCDEDFRRLRVAARQIISFSKAASMGIERSEDAVVLGLKFLAGPARLKGGGYARVFDLSNRPIDETLDLYDHAFVLLAFSSAARVREYETMRQSALELFDFIQKNFVHELGGYLNSVPPSLPRRQNPHMHLLEALMEAHEAFGDKLFLSAAADIVTLFLERFLCRDNFSIPEYFSENLTREPPTGNFEVEPGHHFEWIWLLHKFNGTREHSPALASDLKLVREKLFNFNDRFAINQKFGTAFDIVLNSGDVVSASSRIWPQTERIRAEIHCRTDNGAMIEQALRSFKLYTDGLPAGLWREQIEPDGSSVYPTARASTLYHLTTGFFSDP
jgi:mannose-6-phosphate isomerase